MQTVTIFFDTQDPSNEGWAFRLYDESGDEIESGEINTLRDLHAALTGRQLSQESEVGMDGLPNFGGAEPADTQGVWSWDADSFLVGDGRELEIVSRADWTPGQLAP